MVLSVQKLSRGEETREKLLHAGLTLFGQRGFDGVSARELATLAGRPLSAVTYHFATMEALYIAVVQQMIAQMDARMQPEFEQIQHQLANGALTAKTALEQVTHLLVREIVCCQDHPEWPMLMVREHLTPSPAFEHVFHSGMRHIHAFISELLARVEGGQADSEAMQLKGFAYIGSIIFFRIGAQTIMRTMNWPSIDEQQLAKIASTCFSVKN